MLKLKKTSQKQEKKVAREVLGRTVPASGAFATFKGDVRNSYYLIECKTTKESFYSLTSKVWNKIKSEALKDGLREPLMQIDLEDGNKRFAVINKETFEEFIDLKSFDKLVVNAKSFRVKSPVIVEWKDNKTLIVIDWNDFVNNIAPLYEESILPF